MINRKYMYLQNMKYSHLKICLCFKNELPLKAPKGFLQHLQLRLLTFISSQMQRKKRPQLNYLVFFKYEVLFKRRYIINRPF